jgi:hypothetical protein
MTTTVQIINAHGSNKNQHVRVVFDRVGQPPTVELLAPGEQLNHMLTGPTDSVTIREIPAPKP